MLPDGSQGNRPSPPGLKLRGPKECSNHTRVHAELDCQRCILAHLLNWRCHQDPSRDEKTRYGRPLGRNLQPSALLSYLPVREGPGESRMFLLARENSSEISPSRDTCSTLDRDAIDVTPERLTRRVMLGPPSTRPVQSPEAEMVPLGHARSMAFPTNTPLGALRRWRGRVPGLWERAMQQVCLHSEPVGHSKFIGSEADT
ncbi:hypothetical protein MAPG_02093 [Magnaporthiopsis poae ATCC 64411]|uniref:Uncharacterized protein n=1 Tax=Magnaporthiopsis poae (strain ATCC 64411 / 73-15) TaxID=644358 RepID=A0A0C4DQF3_MAGP6|nr:hypothetical protein MAPG_02093 [Magnaporthiopsis poae ATCC 64411]